MAKWFVVKKQRATDQTRRTYQAMRNQAVADEYIASRIYQLFCITPKVYIVQLEATDETAPRYGIASQKLPHYSDLNNATVTGIQNLDGVCAGAYLLLDYDCVGAQFNNMGYVTDKQGLRVAVKIDPGAAILTGFDAPDESNAGAPASAYDSSGASSDRDGDPPSSDDSSTDNATESTEPQPSNDSADSYTDGLNRFQLDAIPGVKQFKQVFGNSAQTHTHALTRIAKLDKQVIRAIIYSDAIARLLTPQQQAERYQTLCHRIDACQRLAQLQQPVPAQPDQPEPSDQATASQLQPLALPPQRRIIRPVNEFTRTGQSITHGASAPAIYYKINPIKQAYADDYNKQIKRLTAFFMVKHPPNPHRIRVFGLAKARHVISMYYAYNENATFNKGVMKHLAIMQTRWQAAFSDLIKKKVTALIQSKNINKAKTTLTALMQQIEPYQQHAPDAIEALITKRNALFQALDAPGATEASCQTALQDFAVHAGATRMHLSILHARITKSVKLDMQAGPPAPPPAPAQR